MRRFTLIPVVLAFLVWSVAVPGAIAASRSPGDGSLVVTGASGTVIVQGKGVIYGHFDQGTLIVIDYKSDDSSDASVTGARLRGHSYTGANVRFLFPSGRYTLTFIATDINLSAVGKGSVSATGVGLLGGGTFAVNGGKAQTLSPSSSSELFGGSTTTGGSNASAGGSGSGGTTNASNSGKS